MQPTALSFSWQVGIFGGYGKPRWQDTLGFHIVYSPIRLAKVRDYKSDRVATLIIFAAVERLLTCGCSLRPQYLYWVGRWKWDYSIKKKEYTWDDAVNLQC